MPVSLVIPWAVSYTHLDVYKRQALKRERGQEIPRYEEMCRRFLADQEDFSEEKIAAAGITRKFQNVDLEECVEEIAEYIRQA